MAHENRMDDDKRTYGGPGSDAHAAHPYSETERAYVASHSDNPHSPYGTSVGSPNTHIGGTQPIPIKKGLFDGISIAQVIAASAAAATSMLLASRIGIAGSVIGAAVSSMVTVICSQLYRNALDASARKLKAKQVSHAYEQDALRGYANAEGASPIDDAPGAPQIRIAPTKLQARAAAERSASKRKIAVVSALIAIAAVAASAGIIMLTTSGQGLGTKAPSVFASRPAENQASPESDASIDEPIEAPTELPDSNESTSEPTKPEGDAGSDGGVETGDESPMGNAAGGTSGGGDASQQTGPTGSSSGSPQGQADTGDTGAGDGAASAESKKPVAAAGIAAGNTTALALMAGGTDVGGAEAALH